MEFTLDVALVRDTWRREYAQAADEIRDLGPLAALANSLRRQDARTAAAPDAGLLACRAGCAWCCYFTVDVRPVEAFAILDYVQRTLDGDELARVRARIRRNSAELGALDEDARATRNVECPFLNAGRCGIYAARPQSCRNYHATDATGCQRSYEDPTNLEIDPDFAPGVYQAGGAHVEAFSAAMRDAGFDVDAYELNGALEAALSDPGARGRFEARRKPFVGMDGDAVVAEFEDPE